MRSVTSSTASIVPKIGRNLLSSFSTAVLLFAFSGGWVSTAVAGLPPVENIPCLAAPEYNPPANLNCTSGDVSLSSPFVETVKACNFPGDTTILEVKFDVTTTATTRYDLGLWFSVDGDPNGDGSRLGTCSAVVLPSDIFMNTNPPNTKLTDLDGDTCGDVTKTGTLIPQVVNANLGQISLLCSDPDGDGFLDVPVIITWDNTSNNVCNSAQEARPNTGSKCSEVPNLRLPVPIPGQIIVDKVTLPADANNFQFHLTGPVLNPMPSGGFDGSEDFLLNDASDPFDTAVYTGGLTPGVYSVTEDANPAYITSVSCTGSDGAEDPTAIDVSNGETVECVFTNTLDQATINVIKNTLGGDGAFTIQATGPSGVNSATYDFDMVTVSGTDTETMNVSPTGTFEVSEVLVANWDLVGAACVNDDGGASMGTWDQVDTIENIVLTAGDSITCTFTNAAAGSVSLVKNTVGGDGSFDFVTDIPGLGTNIQTAGGTGGTSTTGVPAGTYSIVETVPAGWNLDSATCSDGSPPDALVISNGESVTCTFTNTKLGTIIVEKQTLPDASGQSFAFTGDAAGNITDGQQIMVANLLPGAYTSTETAVTGWSLTSIVCSDVNSSGVVDTGIATFNLEAGETVTCVFTNTQDGSIEVVKSLAATGPLNELFGFTSSFNGNFNLQGDAATTGPISVTPNSGYTVTEDDPTANGWANVGASCDDGSVPSVNITVSPGENVVCTFTNTPLGSATIVKNTIGGDDSFNFTGDAPFDGLQLDTVGGSASQDFTFELDQGQYLVTENPVPAGWALTGLGCVEDGIEDSMVSNPTATINVEYAETVTCTFTNTADATLIIRKETVPDASLVGFDFTGSASGTLHDYSNTAEELMASGQPGTYTSAETVPAGWIVTNISCENPGSSVVSIGGTGAFVAGDADVSVDLVAGETVICTFENTQESGITIEKTSVGDVGLFNFAGDLGAFALDTNNANPDSSAFTSLMPDTYMVSEIVPANWILSGISCQGQTNSVITIGGAGGFDPGDQGVTIDLAAGESITCSFTNTRRPSLALVKTVITDNGGTAVDTDWTLSAAGPTPLSGAGGVPKTFVGMGEYTLSESVGPDGYTASVWSCTEGSLNGAVVTLGAGDDAVCTIVNDDVAPGLTLVKSVTNNNGGTAVATDWLLSAAGPTPISGDGGVGPSDVDAGTYTLSESGGPAGYTAGDWSCEGGTLQVDSLELSEGQNAVCTIVNDDDTANLTLVKSVINDNGGTADKSAWTLIADGPTPISGAGGVGPSDVNAGSYTLSESGGPAGYTASGWSCEGGTLQGSSLVLASGETAVCTIVNDDDTANLTLVKSVVNDNGGSANASNWTLQAAGPTPLSGAGGVAATNVDAGVYTLSESVGPDGYMAGNWSCTAGALQVNSLTLANGQTSVCTIINDDIARPIEVFEPVPVDNKIALILLTLLLLGTGWYMRPAVTNKPE